MFFPLLLFSLGLLCGPGVHAQARGRPPAGEPPAEEAFLAATQCGAGLLGGFSRMELPDADLNDLARRALRVFVASDAGGQLKLCQPDLQTAEIVVVSACRQVVAGTNYAILFRAALPCAGRPGVAATAGKTLELDARVFVPLPTLLSRAPPTVQSVRQVADA